jgi:hypothetical protein
LSKGSRRSNRSSKAAGESTVRRAAASWSASGNPSRRRQISATAAALLWVRVKPGRLSRALVMKRATAGTVASTPGSAAAAASGSGSGATGTMRSPRMRSGSRLVASTFRRGAISSTRSASGASDANCSTLSITNSSSRGRKKASRLSSSV